MYSRTGRRPSLFVACLLLSGCIGPTPPGIVKGGDIEFTGIVNEDYLMAQMVQLEPRLQGCYARSLGRLRTSEGRVGLDLVGGGHKLVPSVTSNTTGDSLLSQCVAAAISSLTIVEPDTGPRWRYTGTWWVDFKIARRRAGAS